MSNSKSTAIRAYLAEHPEAGPKEVIEALKKIGIDVTPGLVSSVKSKMKDAGDLPSQGKGNGRRKASKVGIKTLQSKKEDMVARQSVASFDELLQAKQIADSLGGVNRVKELMDDLSLLQSAT